MLAEPARFRAAVQFGIRYVERTVGDFVRLFFTRRLAGRIYLGKKM